MPEAIDTAEQQPGEGGARRGGPQRVSLWNNYISLIGATFVAFSILLLLTFGLFQVISPSANPYVDIIGLLILPGLLVIGLFIVPGGMVIKQLRLHWRHRGVVGTLRLPRIDLNKRRTRAIVLVFLAVSVFLVLPVLAVSAYHAYHFTESAMFCAEVCHSVMAPQATAYAHSPHARVACAECHIGTGASWFVKSKLSGTRQVLAVWQNSFPRPIPPAITELRPARETCEECHWPAKFFGTQYKELVHFSPDEHNTRRVVKMLLKTGGADESIGRVGGIHMHMVLSGQIEYVATDPGLQQIPWVRYVNDEGTELIYRSDGKTAADSRPEGLVRQIDCMDCHNRGAHHFRSPQRALNLSLDAGRIDATLPFIKREAIDALTQSYRDARSARESIRHRILDFYQKHYPQVWETQRAAVEQAAETVVTIYGQYFFPHMKVNWLSYSENIGHMYSPGCLRCHDGLHVNQFGEPISSDCSVCHEFFVPADAAGDALALGEFEHSMPMVKHRSLRCDQCHTGGKLPLCRECHASGAWLDTRARR